MVVCNHSSLMDVLVTTPLYASGKQNNWQKSFAYSAFFGLDDMAGSILHRS